MRLTCHGMDGIDHFWSTPQKEKEESKTCSVVWFASTRPIRCRSPPPPSRCRGGSGPPAAAEAAAAAAAARRLRQRGRRRLHRGRPWHRAPSGEKADPRKVAYYIGLRSLIRRWKDMYNANTRGRIITALLPAGRSHIQGRTMFMVHPGGLLCASSWSTTDLRMYILVHVRCVPELFVPLSLISLSLSAYTAVTQGALHRRRRPSCFFGEVLHCRTGYSAPRNCSSPCLPQHYRRLNISPLDVRPSVIVCASPLLSCFSFQGGFGASGPSQDQVFEAMEIFGEGIQDFDFNAADEDAEVHKVLMLSSHTYYTYLLCFPIWLDLNGVQM